MDDSTQLALFAGDDCAVTEDGVRHVLAEGVPRLVREVWAALGVDSPEGAARVAEVLRELEAAGRVRCDLGTMRWETT